MSNSKNLVKESELVVNKLVEEQGIHISVRCEVCESQQELLQVVFPSNRDLPASIECFEDQWANSMEFLHVNMSCFVKHTLCDSSLLDEEMFEHAEIQQEMVAWNDEGCFLERFGSSAKSRLA